MKFTNFERIFFDFDGTIVDTNNFKDKAIKDTINKYCRDSSRANNAYTYFAENKGLPRELKLRKYFCDEIVPLILKDYSMKCNEQMSTLAINKNILEGIMHLSKRKYKLYILSGGNELEINACLSFNNISNCFSDVLPDKANKDEHLSSLEASSNDLLLGDSIYDYRCAMSHGVNFARLMPTDDIKHTIDVEIPYPHTSLTPHNFLILCSSKS